MPAAPPISRPTRSLRVVAATALLLGAYIALSLFNDPHGYLGTDTGGKVATLRAMERAGSLSPDIGYWAEQWDPDGTLHPLYFTAHLGENWVNVTTLPALYLGYGLFRVGGYHGALLVPMLGSVLAALAARALARRLTAGDERAGWLAFWTVGVASPLAIYALDFWEHSLGVALIGWAVVLLYDVINAQGGWRAAVGAGLLFGAAATMRTESLVYGAVATAICCGAVLLKTRNLLRPLVCGAAVIAGLVIPLVANNALERAVLGSAFRANRATQTVAGMAASDGNRIEEAILTGTGLRPSLELSSYVIGFALLALLALFARRASQGEARVARICACAIAALYLIRFAEGLGFVPGLVAATPLASVGLALGWRHRRPEPDDDSGWFGARDIVTIAVVALPVVWALQFTGGAGPQWGGRYILPSGFLLGVVGVTRLPLLAAWAQRALIALAALVTVFGVAWLSERSHDVSRAAQALTNRPEAVVVSRLAHLPREAGWYAADRRWLTAVTDAEEARAAQVVADAGLAGFVVVELDGNRPPRQFPGWAADPTSSTLRYFSGVELRLTTYVRAA